MQLENDIAIIKINYYIIVIIESKAIFQHFHKCSQSLLSNGGKALWKGKRGLRAVCSAERQAMHSAMLSNLTVLRRFSKNTAPTGCEQF